jgi:hypothetical protein
MMFLDLDMLLLSKPPNCFYFSLITPFSVFFFSKSKREFYCSTRMYVVKFQTRKLRFLDLFLVSFLFPIKN